MKGEETMIKEKSNLHKAISVLTPGYVREDHFDGVNAIYRLAAYIELDENLSKDGFCRQLQYLNRELSKLSVRPNSVYIFDNMIVINWYTRGFQMVMNRGQYAGLVLQFAKFLDTCHLKGLKILDECFNDDPEDAVKSVPNEDINFFPEFNEKCFGSNEPIEIVCFNEKYGEGRLWL
jgi:hypothetical protein